MDAVQRHAAKGQLIAGMLSGQQSTKRPLRWSSRSAQRLQERWYQCSWVEEGKQNLTLQALAGPLNTAARCSGTGGADAHRADGAEQRSPARIPRLDPRSADDH